MKCSSRGGLLIIVVVFSTSQFLYLYFYGDHGSRLDKLTRRAAQYQGSVMTSGSTEEMDRLNKTIPVTTSNNSDSVFPPLLYNMELYFEKPYNPLLFGKRRSKEGFLTIGIPSVRRPNTDKIYIFETLDSLIKNTKAAEKTEVTIVVYMCDVNKTYNNMVSQAIQSKYKEFCDTGFIHIIQGSQDIYPDLSKVKKTYNDSVERIKWRAKQNIDFAYLTLYSRSISKYYIQLEDDVITAFGYISDIKAFIASIKKPWFLLEFSKLGFIGKLFQSVDLNRVAFYLLSFFDRMPGDLLLGHIRKLMNQDKPIHSKTSLFQHIGKFSSLKNKLMPSIDKYFKDAGSVHLSINDIPLGDNPPVKIVTDLHQYADYSVSYVYDNSENFFWARDVKKKQHLSLLFQKPQQISRIIITTGQQDTKADSLGKSSLLAAVKKDTYTSPNDLRSCGDFKKLTDFVDGEVDTKAIGLDNNIPVDIVCLQIKIEADQKTWVIFRNITVIL